MDRNQFKLIHSELIQQVQCVENNLKIIYAAMCKGNFKNNLKSVEKMNLGKIARELEKLDNSDDIPEFSEEEYITIDEIREIRNYWCHQCYLDFVYIENDYEREGISKNCIMMNIGHMTYLRKRKKCVWLL